MDGTLLTTEKAITARTQEVLKKAAEQGIIILAATGRPLSGLPQEIQAMPNIRYALTSNGARVTDLKENKVLVEHLLNKEKGKKALEILSKYDTLQEVYYDGKGYAEADKVGLISRYHHNPYMWEYVRKTRITVPDLQAFIDEIGHDMDKVQGLFADISQRQAALDELRQMGGLTLVSSLHYNIEINEEGVNKGSSLIELGAQIGIKREEIMAFGDGDNDVDMIREVGFGIAMANADKQVIDVADYVTLSNDEEGVAAAIEKFVLNN